MNFAFERHLRTKELEWFSIINVDENLKAHIIFNNKDRSNDFSENPELKKMKDMDPDLGDEYMKVHVFVKDKDSYSKFEKEIGKLIEGLMHHVMPTTWWTFVHEVNDVDKASEEYLINTGLEKEMLKVVDNPAYKNLNQD